MALDGLSLECICEALTTVVPQFDGGLANLTRFLQRNIFEGLGRYIDDHRPLNGLRSCCYKAGDTGTGLNRGVWVKGFAGKAAQGENGVTQGYDFKEGTFILGYDRYWSDRIVLGMALSYSAADINSKDFSLDSQEAKSVQITAYSTYDCKGPAYIDMMAALAFNNYETTRNIIAGDFLVVSEGEFDALNYALNAEWGYRFSCGKYRFIPNVRALYSRLQIDSYTETGADGLSLCVSNDPVEAAITTFGFKLNTTDFYRKTAYVTEARFNVICDWFNDGQRMTSTFVEGGLPFITDTIRPYNCLYNIGLSLTASACQGGVFSLDGEVDLQRDYSAYTVGMKFRWEF
jgi:outer membrane lipase/esterase